jgi:autotransporter translocation and assembly factor TamB
LGFTGLHVALHGGRDELTASNGGVQIGSTLIAFSGEFGRALQRIEVRAPRTDLADFNGYFRASDTLGGRGSIAIDAQRGAGGALQTSGDVALAAARVRRFALGDVAARWSTNGNTLDARANVRGAHGTAELAGSMVLPNGALDASVRVAGLDLATWLPAAGINAPVLGIVDASVSLRGPLAAPAFTVEGALHDGFAGRYQIQTLTLKAAGDRRTARVEQLTFAGPGLNASALGSAGYQPDDPLELTVRAQSDDLLLLAQRAGIPSTLAGAATTEIRLGGTRRNPTVVQTLDARDLTNGKLRVARVHAELAADPHVLEVRSAEADLYGGRALAAARVPIALTTGGVTVTDAPLSGMLRADRIDLAQFAPLLPKGSSVRGLLDGTVTVSGTPRSPSFGGGLALSGGSYASPLVRSAFTNVRAQLALAGTTARLSGLYADVGHGTLDGNAAATVGDLRDLKHSLAFDGTLTAQHAGLDIARLFAGKIDATIRVSQQRGGMPLLAGNVALSQTRVPLNALLPSNQPASRATPFPVAFDLGIQIGSDVRVQSANVDVGARGRLALSGTLAKPVLDGSVVSTDGTLSFYRTFVLQRGRVAFDPKDGIIPTVDATATTHIPDPSTDVLLHAHGPATAMTLDLAAEPPYDRQQILGLLVGAQAFGAVSGVATTGTGNGPNVTDLAGSYLSTAFTRSLLQPIGGDIGRALGLQDLALGYDFTGGFSASASRRLGKNMSVQASESFGADQRESLALINRVGEAASLQLTVFGSGSAPTVQRTPLAPSGPTNLTLQALAPPYGSSGYVFTYQRKYK